MRSSHSGSAQRFEILQARARAFRTAPTFSELVLFEAVRGKRLGVAFKRQVVIDRYIVDLLAPAAKLVVEVDGPYHSRSRFRAADARRDRRLQRLGYRVLRLSDEMIVRQLPEALRLIREALEEA
jgi:very-short-patch-repair endonuclease